MAAERHLKNAPITEGLIDFRVEPPPGATLDQLESVRRALAATFPLQQSRVLWTSNVTIGPGTRAGVSSDHQVNGFQLKSADGRWVAQLALEGVTLSRLHPYTEWADLRRVTQEVWSEYARAVRPARVVRIGVRFINRIQLPSDANFKDYLTADLPVPPDLPQGLASALVRYVLPFHDRGCYCIITQSFQGGEPTETFPFLLDIDAVSPDAISADDEDGMWRRVELLRTTKNEVFFKTLTERCVRMFE